jgi:hypothetical protein
MREVGFMDDDPGMMTRVRKVRQRKDAMEVITAGST